MQRRKFLAGLGALSLSGLVGAQEQGAALRGPDVIFVPTPNEIVATMLKMAAVTKKDTVYDLGCGDGRIVIAAAKEFGARAVGVWTSTLSASGKPRPMPSGPGSPTA